MNETTRTTSLNSAIVSAIRNNILNMVHTCIPGEVQEWDGSKAKVQPLVRKLTSDGASLDYPVMLDVPIIFPATQDFQITFPIKAGDTVLLIFAERNIDNWLYNGGTQTAGSNRAYSYNDCIAIPGLFSFQDIPDGQFDNTDSYIKFKDIEIKLSENGDIQLKNNGGTLKIDSLGNYTLDGLKIDMLGATESFIKGTTFQPALNAFITTIGNSGTVLTPSTILAWANAVVVAATTLLPFTTSTNMLSSTIKGE